VKFSLANQKTVCAWLTAYPSITFALAGGGGPGGPVFSILLGPYSLDSINFTAGRFFSQNISFSANRSWCEPVYGEFVNHAATGV